MDNQIVVGFTGPIGSGCSTIAKDFFVEKKKYDFLSLSNYIKEKVDNVIKERKPNVLDYQNEGNKLRKEFGNHFLAKQIFKDNIEVKKKKRYIVIDSIRNPGEVEYLRSRFKNFYLIGVYADRNIRWERLRKKYEEKENVFNRAEERDQGEIVPNGQQVTTCMEIADVIIINNKDFTKYNEPKEDLFFKLEKINSLFEKPGARKPRLQEINMNRAIFVSLQSRCLKRQVGAIIVDGKNRIISEGLNRVPEGIKHCEDRVSKCYREEQREAFKENIRKCTSCKTPIKIPERCTNELCNITTDDNFKSNIKLLDLCRALHAEEDAIFNAYKNNIVKFDECILYTTTFPCLMCAKKIINSGIKDIIFIDPYPVEMAKEMLTEANVRYKMFEGVKNNSFFKLFKK